MRAFRANSLQLAEQEKFLSVIDRVEDMALFKLALNTGIRREDIVRIKMSDIDLAGKTIKFWEEKKNREWIVPLTNDVVNALNMYLNTIRPAERVKKQFLFEFTGRTAYNRLQFYLKKAGISKSLSFHDLRRTFMKLAKKKGLSMQAVSQITGDSYSTIEQYYQNLSIEELHEELEKIEGEK